MIVSRALLSLPVRVASSLALVLPLLCGGSGDQHGRWPTSAVLLVWVSRRPQVTVAEVGTPATLSVFKPPLHFLGGVLGPDVPGKGSGLLTTVSQSLAFAYGAFIWYSPVGHARSEKDDQALTLAMSDDT